MAETKEEIAADRDRLKDENAALRAQLAAVATTGPAAAVHRFQLCEGDRAELAAHGVANIGGKRMTRDQVRVMLGDDQALVDLGDA